MLQQHCFRKVMYGCVIILFISHSNWTKKYICWDNFWRVICIYNKIILSTHILEKRSNFIGINIRSIWVGIQNDIEFTAGNLTKSLSLFNWHKQIMGFLCSVDFSTTINPQTVTAAIYNGDVCKWLERLLKV